MTNKYDRIKISREKKGLEQGELAKLVGKSQSMVSLYEKDPRKTAVDVLEKLSEIFNTTVDYLIGLTNIEQKPDNLIEMNDVTKVPILGTIRAGSPIFAQENVEEYLPIPIGSVNQKDSFALKVTGDSMIDAGIQHGDTLLVKKQEWLDADGDIMVVLVNNDSEATVKRMFKDKDGIILQAANKNYKPIVINKKDLDYVKILGKVIKILLRDIK